MCKRRWDCRGSRKYGTVEQNLWREGGRGNRLRRWQRRGEWKPECERDRIFDWLFQSVLLERVPIFAAVFTVLGICLAAFSFLPVSWPLNSSWWVTLPAVCSPNWSQDADALAVSEQYSIYKNAVFSKLNQPGGRLHWGKLLIDKRLKKIVFECFCYGKLSGFSPITESNFKQLSKDAPTWKFLPKFDGYNWFCRRGSSRQQSEGIMQM